MYYVYCYLRKNDSTTAKAGTPYYIGKGKDNRAFDCHGRISVPKDQSKIQFLHIGLDEETAFSLEIWYIYKYGRKDLNTGILMNQTDGGEGASGAIRSEETREKIRRANKGKTISEERRQLLRDAWIRRHEKNPKIKKLKIIRELCDMKMTEESKKKLKATLAAKRAAGWVSPAGRPKLPEHLKKKKVKKHSEPGRPKGSKDSYKRTRTKGEVNES